MKIISNSSPYKLTIPLYDNLKNPTSILYNLNFYMECGRPAAVLRFYNLTTNDNLSSNPQMPD